MTEQPPSLEAVRIADALHLLSGNRDDGVRMIDALCEQRVAAETERWQNRDRQRLEQIDRLQETVQSLQNASAERPAPEDGCGDHWRPGATAPKEHGVEIRIKIAHARGVPAYWDAELQTFVLSRPVNVESVREPLGWQPLVPSALTSTGEQPASPAAADYTEQARELLRKLHCWRLLYHDARPIDDPDVGQIAAVLSAVAGKVIWSDTEEVAYQAGVSDTREKLQEPNVREAAIEALRNARWPRAGTKEPLDEMAPGIRGLYEREVGAIIARIGEMLK